MQRLMTAIKDRIEIYRAKRTLRFLAREKRRLGALNATYRTELWVRQSKGGL